MQFGNLCLTLLFLFNSAINVYHTAGMACWLERQTCDRKVESSNPSRSGRRIFFSRVNFVCRLLFGVRSIPMLPQWHAKYPGHSARSAGGWLHMHTSLAKQVGVGRLSYCLGIALEPIRKWAHMQDVREHLVTVISAPVSYTHLTLPTNAEV